MSLAKTKAKYYKNAGVTLPPYTEVTTDQRGNKKAVRVGFFTPINSVQEAGAAIIAPVIVPASSFLSALYHTFNATCSAFTAAVRLIFAFDFDGAAKDAATAATDLLTALYFAASMATDTVHALFALSTRLIATVVCGGVNAVCNTISYCLDDDFETLSDEEVDSTTKKAAASPKKPTAPAAAPRYEQQVYQRPQPAYEKEADVYIVGLYPRGYGS